MSTTTEQQPAPPAADLRPGDPVRVEIPRTRPSCFYHGPVTVDFCHGTYLGIPRFEHTIAQVRVGSQVRRFPLEYLQAVTS